VFGAFCNVATINGARHDLSRAVGREGEVSGAFVSKTRDRMDALRFLRRPMKRHGRPEGLVTDKLRSYGAVLKKLGTQDKRVADRWENNRAQDPHRVLRGRGRAMLRFRRMHSLQEFA
jgi:putative transposase